MIFEAKGNNIKIDDFVINVKKADCTLSLKPPTVALFNKIFSLSNLNEKNETESIKQIKETIVLILNSNNENITVDEDFITDNFDVLELPAFLDAYFGWIKGIRNFPNLQSLATQ